MLVVVTRREKTDKLRTEVSSVARTEQIQQQPAAIQVVTQLLKRVTYLLVKEGGGVREEGGRREEEREGRKGQEGGEGRKEQGERDKRRMRIERREASQRNEQGMVDQNLQRAEPS